MRHATLYWYAHEYPLSQLPEFRTLSHVSSSELKARQMAHMLCRHLIDRCAHMDIGSGGFLGTATREERALARAWSPARRCRPSR